MNKKQAIKESIEHWERMIEWAKKQNPKEYVIIRDMNDEIKEDWSDDYCSLCKYDDAKKGDCRSCPLYKKYGHCTDNGWTKVDDSISWKDWIKNATKFLEQLKSLR